MAPIRSLGYAMLILTVVNIFNYMDRMAMAIMLPAIKADLSLSDGQLGLLVGIAFSLFYAICGIPIARWADRGVRRNIVALSLSVWSLMTALSGAAQNYWQLFAARMGVGAGEAGGLTPAQSMICDYAPVERRPGLLATHAFGGIAGMTVGITLAGWLSDTIGWRWAFVVLGLPGIALALLMRFTVSEPVRGSFDAAPVRTDEQGSFAQSLRVLWACRTFRLLVFHSILNNFVQFGLNQWWPSFYMRTFGLNASTVGVYLGVATGLGAGSGLLLGGWLANRAAERDVRLPLRIGSAAKLLELVAALGALLVPSVLASVLFVSFVGFFWCLSTGAVLAALYSVVRAQMRVTAGAVTNFMSAVFGIGLGPLCVGLLSQYLTQVRGVDGLSMALLAPLVFLPVSALLLWAASRDVSSDLKAVGAHV